MLAYRLSSPCESKSECHVHDVVYFALPNAVTNPIRMQPSYAQDLGVNSIDHGLYGTCISGLGDVLGYVRGLSLNQSTYADRRFLFQFICNRYCGSIPCCPVGVALHVFLSSDPTLKIHLVCSSPTPSRGSSKDQSVSFPDLDNSTRQSIQVWSMSTSQAKV